MVHGTHDELMKVRGHLCKSRFPFISFYQVGPGDRTQVSWLGSRHLYPLSHCASSQSVCYELWTGRVPI